MIAGLCILDFCKSNCPHRNIFQRQRLHIPHNSKNDCFHTFPHTHKLIIDFSFKCWYCSNTIECFKVDSHVIAKFVSFCLTTSTRLHSTESWREICQIVLAMEQMREHWQPLLSFSLLFSLIVICNSQQICLSCAQCN